MDDFKPIELIDKKVFTDFFHCRPTPNFRIDIHKPLYMAWPLRTVVAGAGGLSVDNLETGR